MTDDPEGATPLTEGETGGLLATFVTTREGADLSRRTPDRDAYLAALRSADRDPDDLRALVEFARS